jgi:hypothetical protein
VATVESESSFLVTRHTPHACSAHPGQPELSQGIPETPKETRVWMQTQVL